MILRDLLVRTGTRASESMERLNKILRLKRSGARQLELVSMEDRLLFSAAPGPMPVAPAPDAQMVMAASLDAPVEIFADATAQPDGASTTEAQGLQTQGVLDGSTGGVLEAPSRELVFIDTGAENYQQLLDDLWSHQDPNRQVDVVLLSAGEDGLTQITETLAQYQTEKLDAVHFVTHGADRAIKLGNTWLDAESLDANRDRIASWGEALKPGADLLIYGCDLAGNDLGRALLNNLVDLTGADIAASIDDTGSTLLGGNWDLEYELGAVETDVVFSELTQQEYDGLLTAFSVTNTNDSGAGSLRQAIINANGLAGTDSITFSALGGGTHTINLTSALTVSSNILIDGKSATGYAGTPLIQLNAAGIASFSNALILDGASDNSIIQGLSIYSTPNGNGIQMNDATGVVIRSNYIGLRSNGTSAGNSTGIVIGNSSNITIGGTTAADRNVISGNLDGGIRLESSTSGVQIQGNYIGTNIAGTAALGNGSDGVYITGSSGNTVGGTVVGARNVISGNSINGVRIDGVGASSNSVIGNYIGTDVTGLLDRGNGEDGIQIQNGASNNTIGGLTTAERNVVSGNDNAGIAIDGATTANNTILGNYIGLGADGSTDIGNTHDGVHLQAAANTIIGSTSVGGGNVISGNEINGIGGDAATGTVIQNNIIGLNALGTADRGNASDGVRFINASTNNTIGGTTAGQGNTIAFNNGDGISISASTGVSIRDNSIYSNIGLGIDLGNNGVTVNDAGDGDTGANNLMNFPVIYAVTIAGSNVTITGEARPGATVEFFQAAADSTGYSEGRTFIGRNTVSGSTAGTVDATARQFSFTFAVGTLVEGQKVTATATDVSNNTSEFSRNVVAVQPAGISVIPTITSTGSETRVNTTTTNLQAGPDVNGRNLDFDAAGNYVVVWESDLQDGSGFGIYAQRYNSAGLAQGGEILVNQTTTGEQDFGVVSVSNDGSFMVVWHSDQSTSNDIYVRSYAANGTPLTGEFRVNTTTSGNQRYPSISNDGTGNYVIVWEDRSSGNNDIRGQRINSAGTAIGSEFVINTTTSDDQTLGAVSMNSSGDFVVTWTSSTEDGDGEGIFGQRFDNAGAALGGQFQISQTTSGNQEFSEIAIDSFGGFVVVWESSNTGGGDVFFRRYDGSGTAVTGETLAHASNANQQSLATVDVDSRGNFIVAWTSNSQDGSGDGIYARRFSAGGVALASEFLVNATTAGSQAFPNVAFAANDDFIIEWEGAGTGDTDGVFYRRYSTQLTTTEAGGATGFQVVLDTAPTASVSIAVSSSNTSEGSVSPTTLTFTSGSWNTPQSVTVTGADDVIVDGPIAYSAVLAAATSSDAAYSGLNPADLTLSNTDNDAAGYSISGTIYEDVDGDGLVSDDSVGLANAIVSVYRDDGDGVLDAGDVIVNSLLANSSGQYTFSGLSTDTYWVVADSRSFIGTGGLNGGYTIHDQWAEQTYGSAGSVGWNGSAYTFTGTAGAFFGGMRQDRGDNGASLLTGEHVTRVAVAAANVTGIDTGFSYNVITNTRDGDEVGANNRTVQGSLRQFIQNSNALVSIQSTNFEITDSLVSGAHTINVASALPIITDRVVIDGTTDASYGSTPIIVLDGASAGSTTNGLTISANDSTIRGLVLNRFGSDSILITGDRNTIAGNYIGTDVTGLIDLGTGDDGISITGLDNVIGGASIADRNVIVGQSDDAIEILGTADNTRILGNYIGVGADGTTAVMNSVGIYASSGVDNLAVGGSAVGEGNVFGQHNVAVWLVGVTNSTIAGNLIGTNAAGTAGYGVGQGIVLMNSSTGNTIGGATAASRNVVSGTAASGMNIDTTSSGNTIASNYIGTDASGMLDLGNSGAGLSISSSTNTVRNNLISGNGLAGVRIDGAAATGNLVAGNLIGVNSTGTGDLGNDQDGVILSGGATSNMIGGTTAADRNIISGNNEGIEITGSTTTLNVIQGNYIGLNATGTNGLGNDFDGIHISLGAHDNTIGGTAVGAGNVVAGNGASGVQIEGSGSSNNVIQANYIGTDATGEIALSNAGDGVRIGNGAQNNTIGGTTASARNVISGNLGDGVDIQGTGTSGNVVQGNYIGTDDDGEQDLGNSSNGVNISASGNTIGGSAVGAGNVISGNQLRGIYVTGTGVSAAIQGNYVGTDKDGLQAIGNTFDGIEVNFDAGGVSIRDNLIAANGQWGINLAGTGAGNTVQGNTVGLEVTQTAILGGAGIGASSDGHTITGNTIGGSSSYGIYLTGSANNTIQGNYIGTNSSDATGLGNSLQGIGIDGANSDFNLIGGTDTGEGNVIANNTQDGIAIASGSGTGISILGNTFRSNGDLAIDLHDNGVTANDPNDIDPGANGLQNFPVISSATLSGTNLTLSGTLDTDGLSTQYRIEFYGNPSGTADTTNGEGRVYLGSTIVTTNGSGDATFDGVILTGVSLVVGDSVTATVTRIDTPAQVGVSDFLAYGSTSEYAANLLISTVNTAPVLVSSSALNSINEDDITNSGTLVSQLVDTEVTDADAGALKGIAIVAADTTNGSWQYTLDGTSWLSLGTPSTAAARLLAADATTRVRFVPSANWNGTLPTALTYHAWDQTAGVNGGTASVAPATVADSFSVVSYANNNGTANWTGAWTETDNNGGGASSGLIRVIGNQLQVQSDRNNDNIYRQVDLSGTASATLSFSYQSTISGGLGDVVQVQVSGNGGGSYTTLATFNNTTNTGSGNLSFDISTFIASNTRIRFIVTSVDVTALVNFDNVQISYGTSTGGQTAFSSSTASSSMVVTAVNDVPSITLASVGGPYIENGTPALFDTAPTITDPDSSNFDTGTLTASIESAGTLDDRITIRNQGTGVGQIGVSGTDVTYQNVVIGTWSGGTSGSTPLVVTFNSQATLAAVQALAGNIQFSNVSDNPSTTSRLIRIVVTDGDGGTSNNGQNLLAVTAVNDAPTVANSVTIVMTGTNEDTPSSPATVSSLLNTVALAYNDVDSGAVRGMAITAATGGGNWQYSTDGSTWVNVVGVSTTNALLLDGSTQLRFNPDSQNGSSATIVFRAWDQTFGTASTNGTPAFADPAGGGTTTAFSGSTANLLLSVSSVNDAPQFVAASPLNGILEDDVSNTGTLISQLISTAILDVDAGAVKGIAITDLPQSNGTWEYTLNGTTWISAGTPSTVAALLLPADATTAIRFVPNADVASTSGLMTYRAWDQTTGTAGGTADVTTSGGTTAFSTGANGSAVGITPINDAPVITAGTVVNLSVAEDSGLTSLGLSGVAYGSGGGVDEASQTLTYAVTSIPGSSLGDIYLADGTTKVVVGPYSLSQIQGMQFKPANNATGTTGFQFNVYDSGGVAFGGSDNISQLMLISVNAVNDAPTVTMTSPAFAYTENGVATAIDLTLTVSDIDSANLTGATVTISGNYANGQDVLAFTDQLGITGSWSASTGVLTLSGTTTKANYQTALRSVTYFNNSENPSVLTRTISVVASDATLSSAAATRDIAVSAVNDAPTISNLAGDTQIYSAGSAAAVVEQESDATAADIDSPNFATGYLTVTIASGSDATEDLLSIRDQGSGAGQIGFGGTNVTYGGVVIGTASGGSGGLDLVITLNANATPVAVTALVRNVTYFNTDAVTPTIGDRKLRFTLDDGDGASSIDDDITVRVQGVQSATVLDRFGSISYSNNDGSQNWLNSWTELGEANGPTTGFVQVRTSQNALEIGSGPVLLLFPANITGKGVQRTADLSSATSATLSLDAWVSGTSLDGSMTLAVSADGIAWTDLKTFDFNSTPPTPTNNSFDITPFLSSTTSVRLMGAGTVGGVLSAGYFYTDNIAIDYVLNTPPLITSNLSGTTASVSVAENNAAVTTVTSTDSDLPSQTLTYSISGGADAAKFTINSLTGVLNFIAAPDYEDPTDSDSNNLYDVIVQVSDGRLTDTQAIAVTVMAVNDAPAITTNALTISEGGTVVLSNSSINSTDPDNTPAELTYSVSGLSGGQFELVASGGTAISSFTQAQINAGAVQFVHNGGEAAPSYQLTVSDGSLSNGPSTVSLGSFSNINDAPSLGASTLLNGITEDDITNAGTLVLVLVDTEATDPDAGALKGIAVTVTTLTNGAWEYTLNGADWFSIGSRTAATALLLPADATTRIRFVPSANFTGNSGSLIYLAWDRTTGTAGGTADTTMRGGTTAFSALSNSTSVTVSPANDGPSLVTNTLSINEGATVVLSGAQINTTDPDNTSDQLTYTVSGLSGGQFEFVATAGTAITSFTQADINSNLVQFVHNGGEAAPAYSLTVSDGSLSNGPNAASTSVTAINDAPTIATNTLTINEGATVTLTNANINTTDPDNTPGQLTYTVSGLSGGQFELVASSGTAITSFTQAQINSGAVQFVHNGGELAPSYTLTVNDGAVSSAPSLVTIGTFTNVNDAPVMMTNTLAISEGGTVVLTNAEIQATDADNTPAQLTYSASSISHGQFELVASPGVAITSFTQAQINAGAVQFVHDGGESVPAYTLTVNDGNLSSASVAMTLSAFTNVNDAPVITAPVSVTITASQASPFTGPNTIQVSDSDATSLQVTIAVSDGGFTLSQTTGLTFTIGDGQFDSSMQFSGSIADINAALSNAKYQYSLSHGVAESLTIDVSDLGQSGTGGVQTASSVTTLAIALPTAVVGDAFLQGSYLEVGLGQNGAIGSDGVAPVGFTSAGGLLAVVVDNERDGWSTFDGDFITPGSPEETWGLHVGGTTYSNSNTFPSEITGGLVNYQSSPSGQVVEWLGNQSGLQVVQTYSVGVNQLYMDVDVALTNLSGAALTDVYYYRNVDPDNNVNQGSVDGFATNNTIVSQGDTNGVSLVTATQSDGSYLGLMGFGENSRVTYGGFDNRDPLSIYQGTGGLNQSGSHVADEAVSLAFQYATIANGETVNLRFRYYFAASDAAIPVVDLDADNSHGLVGGDFTATFTEGGGPVAIVDADATVLSPAGVAIDSLQVTISNLLDGTSESLTVDTTGTSLVAAYNSTTGVLSLSGAATDADYRSVLRTLTYDNTSTNPNTTTRTVTIVATSGTNDSVAVSSYVVVQAVNNGPTMVVNSLTLSEGQSVVLTSLQLSSTDPDTATTSLTYTISGLTGGQFENTTAPGVAISSLTQADIDNGLIQFVHDGGEVAPSYQVTVSDGTSSQGPSPATILFSNVNDAPTISPATFSLNENSSFGTVVGDVVAADPDAADTKTFTITAGNGTGGGAFSIDSAGRIRVADAAQLDFETTPSWSLTVRVRDQAGTSANTVITINLTDLNDNDPVITSHGGVNTASLSITENTTAVTTVSSTDADAGTIVTYSISGNDAGLFQIDPNMGVLSFRVSTDFETPLDADGDNVYEVSVSATDGVRTDSQSLLITVSDISESGVTAIIDSNIAMEMVSEDATAGTPIGITAFADDADGTDTVSYSLLNSAGGRFSIDGVTGVVTLASGVDYETAASHSIRVQALSTDGSMSFRDITINIIDVNEYATTPISDSDSAFDQVLENAVSGTVVGITALADDLDGTDSVSYSLTNNAGGRLAIDPTSGLVTVVGMIDYEATSSLGFTVQALSSDGSMTSRDFVVAVLDANDNAPLVTLGQSFTLAENSPNSTIVGTVLAADVDTLGSLQNWTITGETVVGAFAINAATGEITVNNSALLDFETAPILTLFVTASDGIQTSAEQSVTINLSNVNEAPQITGPVNVTVGEDGVTAALPITVSDIDTATATLVVTATSSDQALIPNSSIVIAGSGANRTITITPTADMSGGPVTITLTVSDGSLSRQTTFLVTVSAINDAPTISVVPDQIMNEDATTAPLAITLSDIDTSVNALTVTASSSNQGLIPDGNLVVSGTGANRTVTITPSANRNGGPVTITLIVSDGALTSQQTFTVHVTAVNDLPVVAPQGFTVSENSGIGTLVGTVIAADIDTGDALTYAISAGNTNAAFAIDSSTGLITVANSAALNFELTPQYLLTVSVTDNSGTPQTTTITIRLLDRNEIPTSLSLSSASVNENSPAGTLIGQLSSTDVDAGDGANYSLVNDAGGLFTVDTNTGAVTVNGGLDFEAFSNHTIVARITDNGGLILDRSFVISLVDLNEAPVLVSGSFGLAENSASGTLVGTLTATDADAGDSLAFSFIAGNTNGAFSINANTGAITIANSAALDFESNRTFTLVAQVTDHAGLSQQQVITVTLSNVNESPTVLASTFHIQERSAVGSIVGMVTASDIDAGDLITYSFVAGNTGGRFAIDPSTGLITVANSVSFTHESRSSYTVTVQVQDAAGLAQSAAMTIVVDNVNQPPLTEADQYQLDQFTSLTTNAINGVLSNDSDPDSIGMTAILVSGPQHGTLTLNANGTLTYSPDDDFFGMDTFIYQATDGLEFSGPTMVTFDVSIVAGAGAGFQGESLDSGDDDDDDTDSENESNDLIDTDDSGDGEGDATSPTTNGLTSGDAGNTASRPNGPGSTVSDFPFVQTNGSDPLAQVLAGVQQSLLQELSGHRSKRAGQAQRGRSGAWGALTPVVRHFIPDPVQNMTVSFLGNQAMWNELNSIRNELRDQRQSSAIMEKIVVGTTTAVTGGLTVGYVVWLIRGGSLLATMVSVVPTWVSFDPLPVMDRFEEEMPREDHESLASIVSGSAGR